MQNSKCDLVISRCNHNATTKPLLLTTINCLRTGTRRYIRKCMQLDCHFVSGSMWLDISRLYMNSARFALTNDTPWLALTGERWGVFRELYKEKWPWYIDSALYLVLSMSGVPGDRCLSAILQYRHLFSVAWWVINASWLLWANQRDGEARFTLD